MATKPAQKGIEPYSFSPAFERALLYYSSIRPSFYGRVGHAIELAALGDEAVRLAFQAAQAIALDNGRGPSGTAVVMQRIYRWSHEGRATIDQIHAVEALFDLVEEEVLPGEEDVASEVVPILQRRKRRSAVDLAIEEYAKRGDFEAVRDALVDASRLGVVDVTPGTSSHSRGSADEIAKLAHMQYLQTGIYELDAVLGGGMPRGQLGVAVGGPGEGKSMFLNHVFCAALRNGLCAAYASLELPEAHIHARIYANTTGLTISRIINGGFEDALRMIDLERAAGKWRGASAVKFFTPQGTTVQDIRTWVSTVEAHVERKVDLLVIDYADKMISLQRDSTEYNAMRDVYEGLRLFAVERNHWCWTASQSKAKEKSSKKLSRDVESMADSMHKGRVADLVITLNSDPDAPDMLSMFVAKNRTGSSRSVVGPLPTDFALGRIAPL